jgi:DNA polymerase-3 subunit gamma/tau
MTDSYIALARKWRPKAFNELVGQDHVSQALINALRSGRVHHAFLFTGTRGVGKTSIARILAKCLNCEAGVTDAPCGQCASCREIEAGRFVDLIEVDAASRTKVDDTREILDNVQFAPTRGRYKVYLIDEVHMLSTHSFNALLKTLEEPPPHVKFLLATTDPQKLPVTVLSRCLQFNLKRIPTAQIAATLRTVLEKEGVAFEPAGVALVAQAADGSMRDALSLLDQLIAFGGGRVEEAEARAMLGTVTRDHVVQLAERLAAGAGPQLLGFARSLEQWAPDYAQLLDELAALLTRVALKQVVGEAYEGDELYAPELIARLAGELAAEDVQLYYQTAIMGRRDLPLAPDPRTGFEMTLLRMIAFRPGEPRASGTPPVPTSAAAGLRRAAAQPEESAQQHSRQTDSSPGHGQGAGTEAAGAGEAQWSALLGQLDLQGAARQLASHCVLIARQGGRVQLALDPRSGSLRTASLEEKLAQALSRHFGEPVRLEFVAASQSGATPAQARQRAARERSEAARRAFESDPGVQSFRERFGAQVISETVRPVK